MEYEDYEAPIVHDSRPFCPLCNHFGCELLAHMLYILGKFMHYFM